VILLLLTTIILATVCTGRATFVCRLSLIRQVCLLAAGRVIAVVSAADFAGLGSGRVAGGGELAPLIVHKLLSHVVNGTGAVLASKIVAVEPPLHASGRIGTVASSTWAALSRNSVVWLAAVGRALAWYLLLLLRCHVLNLQLLSELLNILVFHLLRLCRQLRALKLRHARQVIFLLRRALVLHARAFILNVTEQFIGRKIVNLFLR
jgi:hypothetical protein